MEIHVIEIWLVPSQKKIKQKTEFGVFLADLQQTKDLLSATMLSFLGSNWCPMAQPLQNSQSQLLKLPSFCSKNKIKYFYKTIIIKNGTKFLGFSRSLILVSFDKYIYSQVHPEARE